MPTETFMKLPEEKKQKIMLAAKKEFSRVSFEETSIKRIVEDAGIARGSFYQYFESKDDVLQYMMRDQMQKVEDVLKNSLTQTKGDIFEAFIAMYDFMVDEMFTKADCELHKKIFESMKTGEDNLYKIKPPKENLRGPFHEESIYVLIDTSKLKAQNQQEVDIIIKMLYFITRKALVANFKYASTKQAKEEYRKQMEYLKYGTCKQ